MKEPLDEDTIIENQWQRYLEKNKKHLEWVNLPNAAYKFFSEHVQDQIQTITDILAKSANHEECVLIFQDISSTLNAGPINDSSLFRGRGIAITEIMTTILETIPNTTAENEKLIRMEFTNIINNKNYTISNPRIVNLIAPDKLKEYNSHIIDVHRLHDAIYTLNQLCARNPMIIKIYKLEELTLLGKKYSGDFLDDKNHINQDLTKCYLLEISNLTKLEMTAQLDRYAYGLDYAEKKQATSSLTQKSFVDMVTEPSSKTSQCLLL